MVAAHTRSWAHGHCAMRPFRRSPQFKVRFWIPKPVSVRDSRDANSLSVVPRVGIVTFRQPISHDPRKPRIAARVAQHQPDLSVRPRLPFQNLWMYHNPSPCIYPSAQRASRRRVPRSTLGFELGPRSAAAAHAVGVPRHRPRRFARTERAGTCARATSRATRPRGMRC